MPYQVQVQLPEILRSTLYLLDNTTYPGKQSKAVADLRACLIHAIADLTQEAERLNENNRGHTD